VGIASAVNNDIARVAGLFAVALLPGLSGITPSAYAHPAQLSTGFHHAVLIAAALCVLGGLIAAVFVEGRVPARRTEIRAEDPAALCAHCPVSVPNARP
jgi:hypothetical protein